MIAVVLSMLAAGQLSAGERTPAAIMIVTPKGVAVGVSSGSIFRAATEAIERRTNLTVVSIEQGGIDDVAVRRCRFDERLTCWARTVRRALPDARYLFSITVHPGDVARVGVTLVDLLRAESIAAGSGSQAEREDRLFAASPSTELAVTQLETAALRSYFDDVLSKRLANSLGSSWGALGGIVVDAPQWNSSVIELDGRVIGAVTTATVAVMDVRPGTRSLVLRRSNGELWKQTIDVTRKRAVRVAPPLSTVPRSPIRTATFYAGIGVSVLAAVVATYGVARTNDGTRGVCFKRANEDNDCTSIGATSFGYVGTDSPVTDANTVDPGGVRFVPLAAGLASTGAIWSISSLWLGDDEQPPWIGILIGAVTGVVSFSVLSLAL